MLYRLHQVNKITQDEGTSQARRVIDWARCLRCMAEQQESAGLSLDAMTRLIFLSGVNRHLAYLRQAPGAPAELVEHLSQCTARIPAPLLAAMAQWLRLTEQFRLRWRGSRWMPAYQAGPLTRHQINLLCDLGYALKN